MSKYISYGSGLCNKLLSVLFVLSLFWLAFIAGIASTYYKLSPGTAVLNAIKSGDLWWKTNTEMKQVLSSIKDTPESFKNLPVGIWDRKRAYNGYTLITAKHSNHVFLVDMKGNIVYKWDTSFEKVWPHHPQSTLLYTHGYVNKAQIFANGDLIGIYTGWEDTPYGYGIAKFDRHSHVLWAYNQHAHHDFYIDQTNGNIYTLVHEFIKHPLPGFEELPFPMLADYIVILSPGGKELKRISLLEAFKDTPFALMLLHRPSSVKEPWDHLHTNSIMKLEPELAYKFPMFKAGQILISINNMNTVAVIDPGTRKVIWARKGIWLHQHSARFMPNGDIVLFDNSGLAHAIATRTMISRIIEFDPETLGIKWDYGSPEEWFFSSACGSVQPLPNGNKLITSTMQGFAFEITPQKHIVWQLNIPQMTSIRDTEARVDDRNILDNATRYDAAALPFLKTVDIH